MDVIRWVHFGVLCAWAGVVAVEGVIELSDTRDAAVATRLHYWIDVLIEGPLLLLVLATGVILVSQSTLSTLLLAKIGCGLVAVLANLACLGFVVARHRQRGDSVRRTFWTRYVRLSIVALPFALAAAYLGVRYFHH